MVLSLIDYNINNYSNTIESKDIKDYQQNRYPLLFLDKILDYKPKEYALGLKTFSYNEWFFPSHYEDDPNVPGFVQIECLVQTFIMTFLTLDEFKGSKTNFLDATNIKFRNKIVPGDSLFIEAKLDFFKRGIAKGTAVGSVFDKYTCSADFVIAIPSEFEQYFPKK